MPIFASDPKRRPATDSQIEFLEILLNDLGYDTRIKRYAFIGDRLGREIKYLDELSVSEASELIEELRDERDENREDF